MGGGAFLARVKLPRDPSQDLYSLKLDFALSKEIVTLPQQNHHNWQYALNSSMPSDLMSSFSELLAAMNITDPLTISTDFPSVEPVA